MLIFQHGNYSVDPDTGYMQLTPFQQDGRMQLSRPCESAQDTVQYYAQCVLRRPRQIADRCRKEVMKGYDITKKIHMAQSYYTLQLYEFNGVLKPRMFLQYKPAQMLPTHSLHMDVRGRRGTDTADRRWLAWVTSLSKRTAAAGRGCARWSHSFPGSAVCHPYTCLPALFAHRARRYPLNDLLTIHVNIGH